MTKEQLAKLGIVIEEDEIEDAKAYELIQNALNKAKEDKEKFKTANDKLSKENAEWKRKEQEKLSEEEKQKLANEEKDKQIATLTREVSRNKKINELIGIGYDKELAEKYADAELDGKSTTAIQQQFLNAKLEAQKVELLKGTKDPNLSNDNKGKFTKENFQKGLISMEEMNKLKETDPATYKSLIEG